MCTLTCSFPESLVIFTNFYTQYTACFYATPHVRIYFTNQRSFQRNLSMSTLNNKKLVSKQHQPCKNSAIFYKKIFSNAWRNRGNVQKIYIISRKMPFREDHRERIDRKFNHQIKILSILYSATICLKSEKYTKYSL